MHFICRFFGSGKRRWGIPNDLHIPMELSKTWRFSLIFYFVNSFIFRVHWYQLKVCASSYNFYVNPWSQFKQSEITWMESDFIMFWMMLNFLAFKKYNLNLHEGVQVKICSILQNKLLPSRPIFCYKFGVQLISQILWTQQFGVPLFSLSLWWLGSPASPLTQLKTLTLLNICAGKTLVLHHMVLMHS